MTVPHCARGPTRCDKCRKAAEEEKICLLRIYFKAGNIARPMTEIVKDGKKWCEFDVMQIFKDEIEAKAYAKKNGINICSLSAIYLNFNIIIENERYSLLFFIKDKGNE